MENEEYLKEKFLLDEKYNKQFKILINGEKQALEYKSCEIYGENYCELIKEIEKLKIETDEHRRAFYISNEYIDAQNELGKIQKKLENCADENEKALYKDDLNKAIQKIQTLNVKCENQIKYKTDDLRRCEDDVAAIIKKKEDVLKIYKEQAELSAKAKFSSLIADYNKELNNLKAKYSIEISSETEMPEFKY